MLWAGFLFSKEIGSTDLWIYCITIVYNPQIFHLWGFRCFLFVIVCPFNPLSVNAMMWLCIQRRSKGDLFVQGKQLFSLDEFFVY